MIASSRSLTAVFCLGLSFTASLAALPRSSGAQYLGHAVDPDGNPASAETNTTKNVAFTLRNFKEVTDMSWDTFDLTCDYGAPVSSCDHDYWVSVERGSSANINVAFNVNTSGTAQLYLRATDSYDSGLTEFGWYQVTAVNGAPPPPATVSVTPDGAQITVPSGQDRTYPFTVTNTGQTSGTFDLAVSCTGWVTVCPSNLSPVSLAAGANTIVNVSYRSPLGLNWGTLILRATNSADLTKLDSGTVRVNTESAPPGGEVNPNTRVSMTPGKTVSGTTPVTVIVTWCGYPPGVFDPNSKVIKANQVDVTASFTHVGSQLEACNYQGTVAEEQFWTSTGVVTVDATTGPVTVEAYVTNSSGHRWEATSTFRPPAPRRGLMVVADQQFVDVLPASPRSERFVVTNTGTALDTVDLVLTACSGSAIGSGCTLSPTGRIALQASETATVTASYTTSASLGSGGLIALRASSQQFADVKDSSWTDVTVTAPRPVGVTIAGMAPGLNGIVPRGACVSVALTDEAASECGDLRLVHSLAPVRTMGTVRAPTLLYNSQHARPKPLVLADIRLSAGAPLPPNVTACIKVAGVSRGCGTWPGSSWSAPGETRRVVVAGDDGSWSSGILDFTLEVRASNENQGPYTATDRLVLVNRIESVFGAGWWLAGLEQLVVISSAELLWIGGDGSARRYVNDGGVWRAPKFAALDSIQAAGPGYVRRTAEHARVYYNAVGRHDSTVNMLGHVTRFSYTGTLLTGIGVPAAAGGSVNYLLAYNADKLDSVAAPGSRATRLFRTGARVDSIRDPDGKRVRFGSGTGLNQYVVTSRTNRRGHATSFGYDGGNRVSGATRPLGNATAVAAAETRGLSTAVAVEGAFTEINGPRSDVNDVTRLWINGYGAPWRSRNAPGQETRVIYGATWPGLADSVMGPNRLASRSYFNPARGLPDSVTVFNPLGTGVHAVTKYQWHPSLNRPTSVRSPTTAGAWLLDSISYNADGTKAWEQRGTNATRTNYTYTADRLPETLSLPGSTFSFVYGSLGNVRKEQSALGFLTLHFEDGIGRDTLVITPRGTGPEATDSAQVVAKGVRQRTGFDVMSRDTMTMTVGPAVTLQVSNGTRVVPSDTVKVQSTFDEEGNPRAVTRSYTKKLDATQSGMFQMTPSEWVYDSLNRVIEQRDAGAGWTILTLDPAGNPTATRTPRSHTITAQYDALNRVTQRIVPQVTYGESGCNYRLPGANCGYAFPIIEKPTLCIADDTSRFAYHTAGTVKSAENNWAKVSRGWAPNGLLTSDNLTIRRYETDAPGSCGGGDKHAVAQSDGSSDWAAHRYGLAYEYDLGGRRTALHHPDQLDPCSGACVQRYGYNAITGTLDTLVHPSATGGSLTTRFGYDDQFRLRTTWHPGGVSMTRDYDADGRMYARNGALTVDNLVHDATGRVTGGTVNTPAAGQRQLTLGYSGLGALQYAAGPTPGVYFEEYKTDALGNRLWVRDNEMVDGVDRTRYHSIASESGQLTASSLGTPNCTPAGAAMSSCHPSWYRYEYAQSHDASGNVDATWGLDTRGIDASSAQQVPDESRSYYSADGKLTYYNRHLGWTLPGEGTGVFEEYRYDALGRRVYMRSRRPSTCNYPCEAYVQRTVWDGDQVLYEIRGSGKDGVNPVYMDREGAVATGDDPNLYGVIAYAHGPGIDQPLGMLKEYAGETGGNGSWGYVTPHANWKGEWSYGTYSDGTYCQSTGAACPTWPGFYQSMDGSPEGNQPPTYTVWWGNIIRGQADASGLQYMRNRYYDPKTGRFTQQDPIGLAGGLNLYGYAGGDPVNFSDPFGLKATPMDATSARLIRQLWTGSKTFRAVFRPLVQASASKVDIQIRVANQDDHTLMMNESRGNGIAVQYGFSPRGFAAIDMRPQIVEDRREKGIADEAVLVEEIVHLAAIFARVAKTGVPEACKGDALPCADELTKRIMSEYWEAVAAAKAKKE